MVGDSNSVALTAPTINLYSIKMVKTKGEISLREILSPFLREWKLLIIIVFISSIVGYGFSLSKQKTYVSSAKFLIELGGSTSTGGLSSLAGLAGFNIGSPSDGKLHPELYPLIFNNIKIQRNLIYSKIYLESLKDSILVIDYINTYYDRPNKDLIQYGSGELSNQKSNSEYSTYSLREGYAVTKVISALNILPKTNEGYLEISVEFNSPEVAYELGRLSEKTLREELVRLQTEKAESYLKYVKVNFSKKQSELYKIQDSLAVLKDQNRNLITAKAQRDLMRLESKMSLNTQSYMALGKQLEEAKISLEKQFPTISTIESFVVNYGPTGPNKPLFLLIGGFLGVVIALVKIYFPIIFKYLKKELDENKEF